MPPRGGPRQHVEGARAYVLHFQPYRETSLMLDLFSRDHGRLSVVARGARRPRSALRGVLMAFQPLEASWFGGGEIKTLKGAEWVGGVPLPTGPALFLGYYLNELLLRLLPREDPHPGLFTAYENALQALVAGGEREAVLRAFELSLLRELGYGVDLTTEAVTHEPLSPEGSYAYDVERGPVALTPEAKDASRDAGDRPEFPGSVLLAMGRGDFSAPATRQAAKQLMRLIINHHLGGQRLESRRVFREVFDV